MFPQHRARVFPYLLYTRIIPHTMPIITVNQLNLSQGGFQLLDNAMLTIDTRERVALIGRNGEGKSSFLKILAGMSKADSGRIESPAGTEIAFLSQDLLPPTDMTVYDTVALGLAKIGEILAEYHHAVMDPEMMHRLDDLQKQIEQVDGWRLQQRIEKTIQTLGLPGEAKMSSLSGGWRRRVGIAQVLVREPDLLLLDEPTNHLDLQTIQWLEQALMNYPKSILFITHDRALIRAVATRIIELDRGQLRSYQCNYETYLERKVKELEDEDKANALFDKKLSQEEAWIRTGIKARRTRNEGRVRNLEKLREVRKQRREQVKDPKFQLQGKESETKVLIKAQNLGFSYPGKPPIFSGLTLNLRAGDKIALIGPNGAGKTTLVNVLLGHLEPTTGTLKHSDNNTVAYFDQSRAQIDPNLSVMDNVIEGSDTIMINGKPKHIVSYLNDFLFSPEKSRRKAGMLSGGEVNRLLLAKIFSKPANLLVLDEPTNDLDVESLEVLETLLNQFDGTVLIISHDREFIDNVATYSLLFEGDGVVKNYVGGYSDIEWQRQPQTQVQVKAPEPKKAEPPKPKPISKEANQLIKKIEKLESQIAAVHEIMGQPDFYTKPQAEIQLKTKELAELEAELTSAYEKL